MPLGCQQQNTEQAVICKHVKLEKCCSSVKACCTSTGTWAKHAEFYSLEKKQPPGQGEALPSLQPWVTKSFESGLNLFIAINPCTAEISFI